MKKSVVLSIVALAGVIVTVSAGAQGISRATRGVKAGGMQVGVNGPEVGASKLPQVLLEQLPKTGRPSTLQAPAIPGPSSIGQCYTKARRWIVLESKYKTFDAWTDRLVFTWHVLLDSKTATEASKKDVKELPPYSYFSTTVTYVNIPRGSHAARVCLPPSYLERFGEPKAVGLVITSADGEMLAGNSESEIKGIKSRTQWWTDTKIMDAKGRDGEPMIERRQGLVDRSKTIWSLVNPNDYEVVAQ